MRKGIIMEVDSHFVTLLTPEGEFLKTKKINRDRPYMIGEEITFSPVLQNKINKWVQFSGPKTLLAGMVACLILFFSLFPAFNQDEAYAYMTIEVNPGVEMALDEDLNVIKLRALNNEGKNIIAGINDWEDKSATTVSQLILTSMKDNGFLKNPDQVILSTVGLKDEEKKQQLVQSVQKSLPVQSEVTVVEATKKERKIAKEQGVSTGQYMKSKTVGKEKPVIKKESQIKPAPSSIENEDKNIPSKQSVVPNQKPAVKKDRPTQQQSKPTTITNQKSIGHSSSNNKRIEKPKGKDSHSNGKHEDKGSFNRHNDEKKNSHTKSNGLSDENKHDQKKNRYNNKRDDRHPNGKTKRNDDRHPNGITKRNDDRDDDDDESNGRDMKYNHNRD